MSKILFITLLLLAGGLNLSAQTVLIEKGGKWVILKFPGKPIIKSQFTDFQQTSNYGFYELFDPKGINIKAVPIQTIEIDRVELENGNENIGYQEVKLILKNPYNFALGAIYMLKIDKAKWDNKLVPVVRFEPNAEATVKAYNDPRKKIRVESNVQLKETAVQVVETTLKISPNEKTLVVDPQPIPTTAKKRRNDLEIEFGDPLSENRNHYLKVNLETDDGKSLAAKTKVTIPGLPKPNPKPDIDIFLSSEFGGNLKPQFNLAGVFKKQFAKSKNEVFYFEPTVTFDVGLGATKSKNAIILELPTIRYTTKFKTNPGCVIAKEPDLKKEPEEIIESSNVKEGKKDEIDLPCYYEWRNRNPFRLYSIDTRIGPKFETDRRFSRANALATIQFDFNFDRWQQSIANQRAYLEVDLRSTRQGMEYKDYVNDIKIKNGYSITPRIGFEFGGKLTGEVIENKAKTVRFVIPQNQIFRSYAGFVAVFEWNYGFLPIKLTISEDLFYLGYAETVGNIVDNKLDLRKVRGFHPYGKMAWDIAFDPAKRYNFTIIYENGRAAPNFEYLNSVKAGIRVVY